MLVILSSCPSKKIDQEYVSRPILEKKDNCHPLLLPKGFDYISDESNERLLQRIKEEEEQEVLRHNDSNDKEFEPYKQYETLRQPSIKNKHEYYQKLFEILKKRPNLQHFKENELNKCDHKLYDQEIKGFSNLIFQDLKSLAKDSIVSDEQTDKDEHENNEKDDEDVLVTWAVQPASCCKNIQFLTLLGTQTLKELKDSIYCLQDQVM